MKTLRFKSSSGITATWRIGKNREGKFKALSLGNAKVDGNPLPLDFVPFEMSNAVINGPSFETEYEAECFVREL
jgi:hypothetical protein